jgi:molybdenum ABC transporter molybdate-binding protein
MNTTNAAGMDDWQVGVQVWAERAGKAVLSAGRLELLEEIDRCRSISAAARQIGISFRHAWVVVQEVNEAAGEPLVEAFAGGKHGGGARLTPHGRLAVAVFRDLQERLQRSASLLYPCLIAPSAPACIRVAAAVSLEEALEQLLTDYARREPEVRVRAVYGASDELADQLLEGAPADLFLTADALQLDRLDRLGMVEPDTVTPLADNTLVAVEQAGGTAPVRRPADLAGPAVDRVALAAPSSPLGGYTRAYLEGLGLYAGLLPRAVLAENSHGVLAAVRAGQADVGLAYGSAATAASGCRVLFRARHLPVPIRYAGAVVRRGQAPDQARELLKFLLSRTAARRFRRCGFLPCPDRS